MSGIYCLCSWHAGPYERNARTVEEYVRDLEKGWHSRDDHRDGTGACTRTNSYGTPCECQSFAPDDFDREDDDGDDDAFTEA